MAHFRLSSRCLLFLLCLIFFLLLLLETAVSTSCTTSTTAYDALKDIYNELGGPEWTYSGDGVEWDFTFSSSDPCADNWEGIECTEDCIITVIDLGMNIFICDVI